MSDPKQPLPTANSITANHVTPFPKDEPASTTVSPKQLLDEAHSFVKRCVVLNQHQQVIVALFVLLTYIPQYVAILLLLLITAPERACGKSKLLELLSRIVARALMTSNLSAAFLIRAIHKWQPTLLVDECDTFVSGRDEMAGLINAGHSKATAFVGRVALMESAREHTQSSSAKNLRKVSVKSSPPGLPPRHLRR